jgi:aspartyl protease family protein
MVRPIVWAVGVLLSVGFAASFAGGKLAAIPGRGTRAEPALPQAGATALAGRRLVIASDLRGHYTVHPSLDGTTVRMMVDTGATIVALTAEDARAAGIRPAPAEYRHPMSTANGIVLAASARIREVRLNDIIVRDVEAAVLPEGRLRTSLLGMSFLRRLRGFDVAGGRLTLRD